MSLPELPALCRIYSYAFYNRTNLQNVTLPSTLQNIYLYAFEGCMLDSITIPGKTTEILSYSAWGWPDPETRYLYETLGTKGSSAEPKTLIITSPHSPTTVLYMMHIMICVRGIPLHTIAIPRRLTRTHQRLR